MSGKKNKKFEPKKPNSSRFDESDDSNNYEHDDVQNDKSNEPKIVDSDNDIVDSNETDSESEKEFTHPSILKIFQKRNDKKKDEIIKRIIDSDSDSDANQDVSSESSSETEFMMPSKKKTTDIVEKPIKNSNEIFKELIKRQLPDVPTQWKLNINDMKRICKYINTSIFDEKNCCLWNGYITNINNSNKGTYVNFYFRNKKVALHRLLYSNFVAPLDSSEYLKFNCENKGICCNINHYEKYKYSKNNIVIIKKETKQKESKKDVKEITIGATDPDDLIVNFD